MNWLLKQIFPRTLPGDEQAVKATFDAWIALDSYDDPVAVSIKTELARAENNYGQAVCKMNLRDVILTWILGGSLDTLAPYRQAVNAARAKAQSWLAMKQAQKQ